MPKSFKLTSLVILLLSLLFIAFFFISKQNPIFKNVNPFADDPYDAVGSFTIQLSFLTAFICLLRAFRPYIKTTLENNQKILLLRGLIISILSVLITLITDVIAMIRYSNWIHFPDGQLLAVIVIGMTLFTTFAIWLVIRISEEKITISSNRLKIIITFFVFYSIIFAIYPSNWKQNIYGEIFTVAIGLLLSFLFLRIIINPIFSLNSNISFEDLLDDLSAIVSWIKKQNKFFNITFSLLEKLLSLLMPQRFFKWLNPRLHKWNLAILISLLVAIYLTLSQTIGERINTSSKNFLLIVIIFLFFESSAVLLGYKLFADYLGIFRKKNQ